MTDIERRHDLPRCPFCGQWPADAGEFYVCCVTDGCPMSKAGCVEIEAWCQRPLEREYDAVCHDTQRCLQPGLFAPLDCADAVDHIPEAGAGPADETEEA